MNYVQVPVSAISVEKNKLNRRSANYTPSVWGEHFLACASDIKENFSQEASREHQRLKEEVRKMLTETPFKCRQKLELIDAVQRLGVSYHFESDINASLRHMYDACDHDDDEQDLYLVSLRFRLLRQQGYYVSCDVFNKFKDPEGNFKESLASDFRGLLSLYEAANYRVHDEDILEEALKFTTTRLESMSKLNNFLAKQVDQALKIPIQRTLTRVGARQFMSLYQEDESHNSVLLNFAKLDFNILQKEHQKELSDLTKWWKSLDISKNLPFTRDRLVECYFWINGVYFEPQYSPSRRILTKVIATTSIIDDIYDAYDGTMDELILFTDAIQRWDISALDQLPPCRCTSFAYQTLLGVYSEMEEKLAKEGRLSRIEYSKTEMKKIVRAYFQEAKWLHGGYVPKVEEHLKVALVSCGYMMLGTTSVVLMEESFSAEVFDWITSEPLLVRAASVINRLTDDIVGHELEQERLHVASSIECYMNEYGSSKQEAIHEFRKRVTNAWMDINKECLEPTSAPLAVLQRIQNFARIINLLYRDVDGYTHPTIEIKDLITLVLFDPVTL